MSGKVLYTDLKIIYILIFILLMVWRIKKGFSNGMLKELVNVFSAVISCICIALIFFAVVSAKTQKFTVLAICVISLAVIGIVYKFCTLIFKPLMAVSNVSVIGSLNKFLGAILGLCEAFIFIAFLCYILKYTGSVI